MGKVWFVPLNMVLNWAWLLPTGIIFWWQLSSCVAIRYSFRSAALYHLGYYDDCLQDISLSLKYRYPKNLEHKIFQRRGLCMRKLGRYNVRIMIWKCTKIKVLFFAGSYRVIRASHRVHQVHPQTDRFEKVIFLNPKCIIWKLKIFLIGLLSQRTWTLW